MKSVVRAKTALILTLAALALPATAATPPVPQRTAPPSRSPLDDLGPGEGVARMRCRASAEGTLSGCTVLAELPAGIGVGDAALRQVAANPHLDGIPAGGGQIEANFRVPLTAEQIAAKPAVGEVVYAQADWLKKPTAAQLVNAYPARAQEAGIRGNVTLSCSVAGTGAVGPCKVLREAPIGEGFAQAALKLTQFMQMRPKTVAGVPVPGTATIPINFFPPAVQPAQPQLTCVAMIC